MGRAARNSEGKAILYADKITGSMRRMMEETDGVFRVFNGRGGLELPASVLAGWLLYALVETPFMRLRERSSD